MIQRALLRATSQRRPHHLRSDANLARGPGLYFNAGHSQPRADRRLENRNQRCARRRWLYGPATVARGTHLPSIISARKGVACGTLRAIKPNARAFTAKGLEP